VELVRVQRGVDGMRGYTIRSGRLGEIERRCRGVRQPNRQTDRGNIYKSNTDT
jgi:hypothetical protein